MRTRLFIENNEVELDSSVEFAITKQFEEISNPTVIINDWSKTVSIPFTQKNNALFGHLYNPDRVVVSSGSIGIYFDPKKKLSFRLMYGDDVLMQGYAKLNEVKKNDGRGSYDVTLFGELGKLFSEMKKITFDSSTEDSTYLIDGSQYFEEVLNKETVKDSWESAGQSSPLLIGGFTNYVGFAPNNSIDSGFDYKTFQKDVLLSDTFENALSNVSFTDATGVEPSTAIPDGMLPREIGEYRSYLQIPFVYFNKLFKIFQTKAESLTGYTFELDPDWFDTTNPYWFKLVYMLKKIDVENGDSFQNEYNTITSSKNINSLLGRWDEPTSVDYTDPISGNLYINNIVEEQKPVLDGNDKLYITDNPMVLNYRLKTLFNISPAESRLRTNNGLKVTMTITGENGHTESQTILIADENYSGSYSGAIVRTGAAVGLNLAVPFLDYYFNLEKSVFGDYVTVSYSLEWLQNSYPYTGSDQLSSTISIVSTSVVYINIHGDHWMRSGANFTLNTLWNNEYNVFNEILNYCKIFRIGIFTDDIQKKIKFVPLTTYFSDYTIEDWTDRIDISKDYSIKPISFESRYVLFNYDNTATKLGKQYKEQYGVNYGELRLNTDYNFDDNTKNLFSGVKASMVNTDNILSWTSLYSNKKIVYTFPAERYITCQDSSKRFVDCFGQYYFHNGIANFDDDSVLRDVVISDDTPFQQYNDKYFYSQPTNSVSVLTYPDLRMSYGSDLCVFNVPKENYTYNSSEFSGKNSIYYNLWKKYLEERYSKDNKVVTCYVRLKPEDFKSFSFNKFIRIDNQLYMVNKIFDYNVTNRESTKVELITIQNINGYTQNNL